MRSRPPPPTLRLPKSDDRPFIGGTAASVTVHGLLILLVAWTGGRVSGDLFRSGGGLGPAGGGGGGGSQVTYVELPPYVTAAPAAREAPTPEREVELPIPRPSVREIPAEQPQIRIVRPTGPIVAAEYIGRAPGSGGDRGAGTGTGGGIGTGEGQGVGSGVGPGTGGEGGDGLAPRSRQMLLPPDAPSDVKGTEYRVRFWIDERGRVTDIDVDPPIRDPKYRKTFRDRMMQYRFYPARRADGTLVAAHYDVWITP